MFWTFTSKELLSSCSLNVFQERRFAQGFRDLGLHKTWNFWLKIWIFIRRLEVVCYVPERGESRSTIFWSLMQAWTNSCLLTRYQDMIRIQQNLDKYLQICFETYFDVIVYLVTLPSELASILLKIPSALSSALCWSPTTAAVWNTQSKEWAKYKKVNFLSNGYSSP